MDRTISRNETASRSTPRENSKPHRTRPPSRNLKSQTAPSTRHHTILSLRTWWSERIRVVNGYPLTTKSCSRSAKTALSWLDDLYLTWQLAMNVRTESKRCDAVWKSKTVPAHFTTVERTLDRDSSKTAVRLTVHRAHS